MERGIDGSHNDTYAVSLDGLLEIMAAWNRVSQDSPVSKNELARVCTFGSETIRKQYPFLEQIGFLMRENTGHRLTEVGRTIAGFIDHAQTGEFHTACRELLLQCAQMKPVLEYLRGKGRAKKKQLLERVILLSGRARDNKDTKSGAQTFVDLLLEVGIIEGSEEDFVLSSHREEAKAGKGVSKRAVAERKEGEVRIRVEITVWMPEDTGSQEQALVVERLSHALHALGFAEPGTAIGAP